MTASARRVALDALLRIDTDEALLEELNILPNPGHRGNDSRGVGCLVATWHR